MREKQKRKLSVDKEAMETSRESTPITEDVIEAASVLDRLKAQSDSSILDKVVSHPIISNSISYVLEKTIHSANTNLMPTDPNNLKRSHSQPTEDTVSIETLKKRKVNNSTTNLLVPPAPIVFGQKPPTLRQQVSISSALANTQRSLQDIKDLSTLNLNIESRKKLTMLIHFLRLGNNQLNDRIENLIKAVDKQRTKLRNAIPSKEKSASFSPTKSSKVNNSKPNDVNVITSDIITTVKKIVNVVSKVPAESFSEPARKKIRDALLKLPTNWSNNELHFLTGDDLGDSGNELSSSSSSSEGEDEDEDEEEEDGSESESNSDYEDTRETPLEGEQIPTIKVTNKRLFQKIRRPSITRRLLNSLIEYRQRKQGKSTVKMKHWFKRKIKHQIMNDSSAKALILAQESLDMVSKIIKTCNESLSKAENWNTGKQLVHQLELLNKLKKIDSSTSDSTVKKEQSPNPEVIIVKEGVPKQS